MKTDKDFIKKLNEKPLKKDKTDKLIDIFILFTLVVIALSIIFGTFLYKL